MPNRATQNATAAIDSMGQEEGNTATGGLRRRRVLVFPLPYQGHINPMFQLAGLLHARGFAITVFHAHFNAPDPSRHPAYDFVPLPDGMSAACTDDTAEPAVIATIKNIFAVNTSCEASFRERLAALLEAPGARDDVACLIADAHLLTLVDVARQQGVPTLALRTGSAACFRCFLANPMLCDKGYLPAQESQLDTPVRELPPYRVRDLMAISRNREEHDLTCKLLSRAVEAARTSTGFILNTFDALETDELATVRQDLGLPVFDVGPLHKISPAASSSILPQDRACLEWLDAQAPSVLYVSFGSLANMSGADLAEMAWGIANAGQPFLWVLRSDLVRGAARVTLPDGFDAVTRERGMVVEWAPQEEVLAHGAVGGFWTHGGWNSTLEGVCGGVPMLCRPYFGDQMGNARYVELVWRTGLALEGELERSKVEEAIRRLMRSEEGGRMRERAQELKRRAAEAITDDAAGSSLLSIDKLVNHILSLSLSK
uniref:Uncharacterized protein n=1 Tax=Avena sativa TaxID=4498 RepID=A0ACD5WHW2_AVESA